MSLSGTTRLQMWSRATQIIYFGKDGLTLPAPGNPLDSFLTFLCLWMQHIIDDVSDVSSLRCWNVWALKVPVCRGLTSASHHQRHRLVACAPECFASGRQHVWLQHSENSLFLDLTEGVARQQGSDVSSADVMWRRLVPGYLMRCRWWIWHPRELSMKLPPRSLSLKCTPLNDEWREWATCDAF